MPTPLTAVTAPDEAPRLGFYGKVPMRGDFLSRRLPRQFIDPWDQWLQEAIAASREQLGETWLPAYLTAPIWRFVLSAGVCGDAPAIGVVMPSVDRVGRYFPLALVLLLPECRWLFRTMTLAEPWFAQVEQLALDALDDGADLEHFERAIEALAPPAAASGQPPAIHAEASACFVPSDMTAEGGEAASDLVDGLLISKYDRGTLWSTTGSERVQPGVIAAAGLPPAQAYAAFLDGQWERWGWMTR